MSKLNFQKEVVNKYRKVLTKIEKFLRKCDAQKTQAEAEIEKAVRLIDNAEDQKAVAEKSAKAFRTMLGLDD